MAERFALPIDAPVVSVVVPALNAERFLGEALDSLRAQTLKEIEIIVIDDGSTDGTAAVARAQATEDQRIRFLHGAESAGTAASARNRGLAVARGRYIAFLDADDTSVPTRLESAVRALEETGTLVAFSDMRRFYEDRGELAARGTLADARFLERAASYVERVDGNIYLCSAGFPAFLLTYIAVNTPTVVFDHSLLELEPGGFDESLVRFEDVDLWFRWAAHTQFAFVNEVHTTVRKHAASLTAVNPVDTRIDGIAVRKKHFERLRGGMSATEIGAAEQNISKLELHVAYAELSAGRYASARSWYARSWRTKPSFAATLAYVKTFVPRSAVAALRDPAER